MIKNYFKIAWRNLLKQRAFSFINVFGLAAGLTCFLLIALYITDELTFDAFHTRASHIYRIAETATNADGQESSSPAIAYNISEAVRKDLPEITDVCRYGIFNRVNVRNEENTHVFYEDYITASASFFQLFDFPLLQGNRDALTAPYTIALSDQEALKIFGRTDVLDKTLRIDNDSLPYKITAVVKVPGNSHLQFKFLVSEATRLTAPAFREFVARDWSANLFACYLVLKDGQDPVQTAGKITRLVQQNRSANTTGNNSTFQLQQLRSIHFYPEGQTSQAQRNVMHLYIFGIVALFVLFIACINYMNLTTARFASRSKEIAVRKVSGALRGSLIAQFLTEALLITTIALVIALAAVQILLPSFNNFTGKTLTLGFQTDYHIWLGVLVATVLAALMAGIYPALFQSGLKPLQLLKNKLKLSNSHLSFRRALVVFQFSISIIMMIATIVVFQQLKYVDTKDMGFNKDQLVVIDINSRAVRNGATTIKNEYAQLPAVQSVTVTSRVPGEWKSITRIQVSASDNLSTQGEQMFYIAADDQFLNAYQVKLQSGRNFLAGSVNNDSQSVIINATAAKALGITEPTEQLIEIPAALYGDGLTTFDSPLRVKVVGIVNDFNFQSLREKIAPMVIGSPNLPIYPIDYFTARVSAARMPETLKQMEDILHKIDAAHIFEYNFLDKQWELFYLEDKKREVIFLCVAFMTILIACLGLFGLATYAAEQRIKEIGIRKVLGASVGSIITMLSKDFLKLVLAAALIAFPIAGWAMYQWLQEFAYRVNLQWWVFLLAGSAALLIALFTVSFRAVKAALANPVKSLRSE